MHPFGLGALRSMAAGALLTIATWSVPAAAGATVTSFEVGDQPIVNVSLRNAVVQVKTWDRNIVQTEWSDTDALVAFKGAVPWERTSVQIPGQPIRIGTSPSGPVTTNLPPEDFPVTNVAQGMHDSVVIKEVGAPQDMPHPAEEPAHVTVTVPQSTRILNVRQHRGQAAIADYHGTTFITMGAGHVTLSNVSGDVFAQVLNGHLYAVDSTFDRIRVRSNTAQLVFERCRSKQIDATTYFGNIVYDNGAFDPGLAHFESEHGNIGVGVNGNAQVGARSQEGKVYTMFEGRSQVDQRASGETSATVGAGGPLVSAVTNHGSVYLYDGSLATRKGIPAEWRPVHAALIAKRRAFQTQVMQPPKITPPIPPREAPRPRTDRHPRIMRLRPR